MARLVSRPAIVVNVPASVLTSRISRSLSLSYLLHHPIGPSSRFFHDSPLKLKSRDSTTSRSTSPNPLPYTSRRAGYDPNARLDPRKPPDATSRSDRRAMSREQLRLRMLGDRESLKKVEILQSAIIRSHWKERPVLAAVAYMYTLIAWYWPVLVIGGGLVWAGMYAFGFEVRSKGQVDFEEGRSSKALKRLVPIVVEKESASATTLEVCHSVLSFCKHH